MAYFFVLQWLNYISTATIKTPKFPFMLFNFSLIHRPSSSVLLLPQYLHILLGMFLATTLTHIYLAVKMLQVLSHSLTHRYDLGQSVITQLFFKLGPPNFVFHMLVHIDPHKLRGNFKWDVTPRGPGTYQYTLTWA